MNNDTAEKLLKPGTIGVIPTDTVYGVVARANDESAVRRLYELKKREHKPGTVIAASIDQLVELGIPRRYLTAVKQFWPGAVSVIVPANQQLLFLHQGKNSLAIRIPSNADLRNLLVRTGPLLTSSANTPGAPTAISLGQSKAFFGDNVDFYIDGGDLSNREPSTIIRVIDDAIEIVRQGSIQITPN